MANKIDIIKDAKELFDHNMPDEMKAFAANQVISDWFRQAVDKGLDGIVCDQVADDMIEDPGDQPADDLTADQLRVYQEK